MYLQIWQGSLRAVLRVAFYGMLLWHGNVRRSSAAWSVLTLLLISAPALAMTYEYDSAGRLKAATNSSGDTALYDYDSRGNLLRIRSISGAPLSIMSFSPGYGEPGVEVVIRGTGFATSTSGNDVYFDGLAAPVLAATSTELLVMVPVGASSGPISIDSSGNSATSSDDFHVTQIGLPPEISSVSPTTVVMGTSVVVSGANLLPYPGQTSVTVSGLYVPITAINDGQITVTVPPWLGSGRIEVTTAFGRAISSQLLTVAPIGVSTAGISSSAIVTTSSSHTVVLASASKYASLTVEGLEDDYYSLHFSSFSSSVNSVPYSIYSPSAGLLASGTVSSSMLSIHLPAFSRPGAYTVLLGSGAGTAQFDVQLEKNPVVGVDGAGLSVSTAIGAQSRRVVLPVVTGDNLGLGITGLSMTGGSNYTFLSIYRPDGSVHDLSECMVSWGGCEIDLPGLQIQGRYGLIIAPASAATMSFTLTASHDLSAELAANTPSNLNIARHGQNARYTFSGVAGAPMGLQLAAISTNPASKQLNVTVYKPDGTAWRGGSSATGMTFNLENLPVTGTYSVLIDPASGVPATAVVNLAAGSAVAAPVDGASLTQTMTATSQVAYFTFDASQGDNLGLGISGLSLSAGTTAYVSVYSPNGTVLLNMEYCFTYNNGCGFNLQNIPATGTYAVMVMPPAGTTTSFTATVSRDVTETLSGNTPLSATLSRRGQNARYSFSGTAGMAAGLQISGISTTPAGSQVSVSVFKPDGSYLAGGNTGAGTTVNLANLPVTGTYSVYVDPHNGAAASYTVNLATGSSVSVPLDGASMTQSTTPVGQVAYINFDATQGENVGLGISNLTLSAGTTAYVSVYSPNGTVLRNMEYCFTYNNGCGFNLSNLPATGTYGVLVAPASPATMSFVATASRDLNGTLNANTPLSETLGRRGQNARYNFSGTAGMAAGLQISGISTTPAGSQVSVSVFKPDGSYLAGGNTGAGTTINLANLPVTGTYSVYVDPHNGAAASYTLNLATGSAVAAPVDGGSLSLSTSSGQVAYFNFEAMQGDNLGLGISNLSASSGTSANIIVHLPNGTAWTALTTCNVSTGCDLNLSNVPTTGTYAAMLSPVIPTATLSFDATISTDRAGSLTAGVPELIDISRRGQNARYGFPGVAAGSAVLAITGISTTPSGRTVVLTLRRPDGTQVATASVTSSHTFNLTNLPVTGTYTLWVDPSNGAAAQLTATLQ